jgi:DNA-binding FadR family transcriptional regulator
LGQQIVGGALPPGEVLPREELLAERMEVSRSALREAIKVLSAKGLVESRPKVGTRVREKRFWHQLDADVLTWRSALWPDDDFVNKLVEMREIVEPAAAAAAARCLSEGQLARLQSAYEAMAAAPNLNQWIAADLKFHATVLEATDNELISALFSVIETALSAYFVLSGRTAAGDFKYSLPHHKKVVAAIRRQQPEAARRHMKRLVADSRANIAGRRR